MFFLKPNSTNWSQSDLILGAKGQSQCDLMSADPIPAKLRTSELKCAHLEGMEVSDMQVNIPSTGS